MTENKTPRNRIVLTGISSRAWEHPADRGALVALRRLNGFDTFVRKVSGVFNERMVRMLLLGSAVRVSERQFPRVHMLYREAAATLNAPSPLPELFVQASPRLNASTIGMDAPKILLDSALVDLFDDDELRFVLGHELGHALSGHAVYRTLLAFLVRFSTSIAGVPFGYWGVRAISAGLAEWARKAELSSDRAGLLSTQDVGAALRVHMKTASGGNLEDLDQGEFLAQASEYEATEDLRDSILKLMLMETATHPFAVIRAGELQRWVESGDYSKILAGTYPRREEDKDAKITAEAAAAAESYLHAFRHSQDAIAKLLRDLGDGVGDFANWVGGKFRG